MAVTVTAAGNLPKEILEDGVIHVWLMRKADRPHEYWFPFITMEEQRRLQVIRSPRRQAEWLAGRALLRQCLAHYTGVGALALVFDRMASGKPFLQDIQDAPAFNLSHGPGWLACAVARAHSVGIDVDSEARRNRTDDIAARYFHPLEQQAIAMAEDPASRRRAFFLHWTLKEAYIKALGEQISNTHLQDIPFATDNNNQPHAAFKLPSGYWEFRHGRFDGDHHLALACRWSGCDTGVTAGPASCRFREWDLTTQTLTELTDAWLC